MSALRPAIRWLTILALLCLWSTTAMAQELTVWHAYRGAEEDALKELVETWNADHQSAPIRLLAVPYDAFANKLTSAIPRGNGPDVFIAAHERAGDWTRAGLLEDLSEGVTWSTYHPVTVDALTVGGKKFGIPLAYKSIVLFYNTRLIDAPPATTDELIEVAKQHTNVDEGRFGLAYEATNFYMHAPWLFGFGGSIFDDEGHVVLDSKENVGTSPKGPGDLGRQHLRGKPDARKRSRRPCSPLSKGPGDLVRRRQKKVPETSVATFCGDVRRPVS